MRCSCAVIAGLLTACGGDTGEGSAPSASEDRPLAADFEEVYRVGGIAAEGWDAFTEILDLDFDARGHLYIRDETGSSTRFVVVDGAGALVADFGRMGDGPGELRDVEQMVARPEGGAVIVDDGHRAYLLSARTARSNARCASPMRAPTQPFPRTLCGPRGTGVRCS